MLAITHVPSPHMARAIRSDANAVIDVARARRQHEGYCAMLARAGARVVTLDVNLEHPDCVFVEDTAVVLDEIAVVTSMGAPSRRAEPAGIEAALREHRPIARLEPPATLEGGDVLRVGRALLVGLTERTSVAGARALEAIVRPHGYTVEAIDVDRCLHLKTACAVLPDGSLLANPAWIDPSRLGGRALVTVPAAEPRAANVLLVGDRVCLASAHPRTAALLRARGFDVDATDLDEFAKADGATTCLSLLVG
jgi:dimethylargininase